MEPLSGRQFQLRAGDYKATIASVGASLRELTWQDRHLVVPYGADEIRPLYRGAVLAPWPNRVVDGRYQFDGVEHQLALTEPDRGHALHGLAVWHDFAQVSKEPGAVALGVTVPAQAGYPFQLRLVVTYSLTEQGLAISLEATNTGHRPASIPTFASVRAWSTIGFSSCRRRAYSPSRPTGWRHSTFTR